MHRNVCKIVDNFMRDDNPMFGSSMLLEHIGLVVRMSLSGYRG